MAPRKLKRLQKKRRQSKSSKKEILRRVSFAVLAGVAIVVVLINYNYNTNTVITTINNANRGNNTTQQQIPQQQASQQQVPQLEEEENESECSSREYLYQNPHKFLDCIQQDPTPSCGKNGNLEDWERVTKEHYGKYSSGQCLSKQILGEAGHGPSGVGSSVKVATPLIQFLNDLLSPTHNNNNNGLNIDPPIQTFLDCPCGDFVWMQEVDLSHVQYFGADISRTAVDANTRCFADVDGQQQQQQSTKTIQFYQLDWTCQKPPPVDLILVRDLLFHLPTRTNLEILNKINNMVGSRYLMTTTFPNITSITGGIHENFAKNYTMLYRNINLYGPPYNFPKPIAKVLEKEHSGRQLRHVGLWKLPIPNLDLSTITNT